jgi:hypothetical protein
MDCAASVGGAITSIVPSDLGMKKGAPIIPDDASRTIPDGTTMAFL